MLRIIWMAPINTKRRGKISEIEQNEEKRQLKVIRDIQYSQFWKIDWFDVVNDKLRLTDKALMVGENWAMCCVFLILEIWKFKATLPLINFIHLG